MGTRGANMVRGVLWSWQPPRAPGCLEEEARADAGLFLGLLPSHRSDKNGVSEDCGPGEEEQDAAVCVLG